VGPPLDTLLALVPRGGPSPTFRFSVNVAQLFAAEGTYPLTFRSQDADSLVDSLKVTLHVDRTPPAPPFLSPPLPAQTKSQTVTSAALVDTSQVVSLVVGGGAGRTDTLIVTNPRRAFVRTLLPGPNTLFFESIDRAHNISPATTAAVVWETSAGLVASERFHAGQSIQVDVGDAPATSVTVRILALDGSLVRTFSDTSSRLVYSFPWDLTTPEGRAVKNGAYLVVARVVHSGGTESLYRQMIAVAE
jgi:flagellar hook capping protein FlgD